LLVIVMNSQRTLLQKMIYYGAMGASAGNVVGALVSARFRGTLLGVLAGVLYAILSEPRPQDSISLHR
jgi:hypothetical protein